MAKAAICARTLAQQQKLRENFQQRIKPLKITAKLFMQLEMTTQYLKDNFEKLTAQQMAEELKVGRTNVRARCYELGLYHMQLEYWTPEQVADLRALYTTMGDLEIAALFQERYPKDKRWTKKHIEKKRKYLKLNRSPETLEIIHARFLGKEVAERDYVFKSRGEVGERRIFHKKDGGKKLYIKQADGAWRPAGPVIWKELNGPVPEGHQVYLKDGDPCNCAPENLGLIKTSERGCITSSKSSVGLSDRYVAAVLVGRRSKLAPAEKANLRQAYLNVPELLHLKRAQLLLKRALNPKSGHAQK